MRILVVPAFLFALVALAAADLLLVEQSQLQALLPEKQMLAEEPSSLQQVGVRPATGPDVRNTVDSLGFVGSATDESTILQQVVPNGVPVDTTLLLDKKERVALLSWIDTADVKRIYVQLKNTLHTSFSTELQDLLDETQRREGHPIRNLLTFKDPALAEERVVFVRVRKRLYEVHIAEGRDEDAYALIDALSQ